MNEQTEKRTIRDLAREVFFILRDLERDNLSITEKKYIKVKQQIADALSEMGATADVGITLNDNESMICIFEKGMLTHFEFITITKASEYGLKVIDSIQTNRMI